MGRGGGRELAGRRRGVRGAGGARPGTGPAAPGGDGLGAVFGVGVVRGVRGDARAAAGRVAGTRAAGAVRPAALDARAGDARGSRAIRVRAGAPVVARGGGGARRGGRRVRLGDRGELPVRGRVAGGRAPVVGGP